MKLRDRSEQYRYSLLFMQKRKSMQPLPDAYIKSYLKRIYLNSTSLDDFDLTYTFEIYKVNDNAIGFDHTYLLVNKFERKYGFGFGIPFNKDLTMSDYIQITAQDLSKYFARDRAMENKLRKRFANEKIIKDIL